MSDESRAQLYSPAEPANTEYVMPSALMPLAEDINEVNSRCRTLFESMPIPTFIWSVTGDVFTLIGFNPAAERWSTSNIQLLINKTVDEIYPDRPDLRERFHTCMAQHTAIIYETAYRMRTTQADRVVEFTFAYATPHMMLLHAHDVTERRAAEAALRQEQASLRALLENTDAIIWSVDRDYRLIVSNERFRRNVLRATGSSIEAGEDSLPAQMSAAVNDEWRGYYDRALRGEQFAVELLQQFIEPPAWLDFQFGPIYNELGDVTGVTVLGRNITERKRVEINLRESEERFRLAFENANDGVCLVGVDGRLLRVNQRMCEMFGYSQAEMEQMSVNDLTHPDYKNVSPRFIRRAVEGHGGHDEFEKAYIHRNGRIVWGRVSSSLVTDAQGEPLYFISHVQDITARKQAEQEREQLYTQLLQSQKMETIGRLAGGIAHDFNNMLAVILMRTELSLPMVATDSLLHRNLMTVFNTAQRSAELVRQLLAFARKQAISPRPLDLNATVEALLPMLHRLIGEEIALTWTPAAHLWVVEMDPSQIDQILVNLCVNARDAIDGVGAITIETANVVLHNEIAASGLAIASGEYVMLSVTDNGAGIPDDVLPHIFEPFFTTKEVGKGSGLGLATVDGIVQQNGGHIQVSSTPGRGATFRIYLPRHLQTATESVQTQVMTLLRGEHETIMLVEDEDLVLQMMADVLQHLGYKVISFSEPTRALQHLQATDLQIDLLLTDVIMPTMTGRDLAEQVAVLRPGIKVLYISGYPADTITQNRAIEADKLYLQKPFSLNTLAAKIRRALELPAAPSQTR